MAESRKSEVPTEVDIELLQFRKGSRKFSLSSFVNVNIKKDDEDSSAPDGGWGWMIVFASFMLNLILDGITLSIGIFIKPIQEVAPWISDGQMGGVASLLSGVTLLVGPLSSSMSNHLGFRLTIIIGAIIAALGLGLSVAVSPHTPNIWSLLILYGIFGGIGYGLMFSPSVVIVGLYFNKRRALATGIAICGTGGGIFLMPPILQKMIEWLGWSGAILVESGLTLSAIAFAMLIRPLNLDKKSSKRASISSIKEEAGGAEVKRSFWVITKGFLTSPTFMLIAISGSITMLGFYVPYNFLPSRAEEYGKEKASYLLSIIGISNIFGRIGFGYISDLPWTNSLMLSNGALTVCGLSTASVALLKSYPLLVVYCIVFGLSIGCFTVLRSILVLHFLGLDSFNDGFGLTLLFMGVSTLGGAPLAGTFSDYTGNYDTTFGVAGTLILISAIMCYPLQYLANWETQRKLNK